MSGLSRRQFVVGASAVSTGLLAGCGRWPWQALTPAQPPKIGYLTNTRSSPAYASFLEGLRELGYAEGQNILIDFRVSDREELAPLASELARLPAKVLVTQGGAATF